MNVGTSDKHTSVDGYYSHDGSLAQVDLSANYHEGQYTSAGLSLQGGATLTAHGGALHRTQNMGGTRLLIDADGVADVPVEGNGAAVYTNMFGKAVVSDVNNYYRNQAYIDLNKLPENAEATQGDHGEGKKGFFGWLNRMFEKSTHHYTDSVGGILRSTGRYLVLYLIIVVGMAYLFVRLPSSFL